MRLFVNQTNRVYTDPVMDISVIPNVTITDATVECNLYDADDNLITDSDIVLVHENAGIYGGEWPVLDITADVVYYIEVIVTKSAKVIWYTKQAITARINK